MLNSIHALTSLDGRYAESVAPLRQYFSEFAFLRDRIRVEADYLAALARLGIARPLSAAEQAQLQAAHETFNEQDAQAVQTFERETRHDVKAIEYFLREKLPADLLQWLHFGLTSEDVNNLAQAIELRDSRDAALLPALNSLLAMLEELARRHAATPMLARTHGQPAVPTTLGKEFSIYAARLKKARDEIAAHEFEAKLSGAVGNLNALVAAFPKIDWLAFGEEFIAAYGLRANFFNTQILPYDNWLRYFDKIRLANSILIDFSQDLWRYISDGWLKQAVVAGEVGSSTMPQKVNPIDFENAEGNLGVANALFLHYAQKLPVSRLQRDLSDSTVRRTFGAAFGHSLLAWNNLQRGLKRIDADEEKLRGELLAHWEILGEAAQTILRAVGKSDAYETLKEATRGRAMTEADFKGWVESAQVDETTRDTLRALSPLNYLGAAEALAKRVG